MGFNASHMKVALLACTLAAAAAAAASASAQSLPGCNSFCGNLTIPYPFGTREGCHRDENFLITCNTTSGHPIAYYSTTNIPVLNISLDTGELRVLAYISWDCNGPRNVTEFISLRVGNFALSNTRNKLTVVGCDTFGLITDNQRNFSTGCLSMCNNIEDAVDGSCSGIGCCQTNFPKGIWDYQISTRRFRNQNSVQDFNPCGYAFTVEDGSFNFSREYLRSLRHRTEFPVLLNWAVDNNTCDEAKRNRSSYACKDNSTCEPSDLGYLCKCQPGFQGNPYLSLYPHGCQDVDECGTQHNCSHICHNTMGSYTCSCPRMYKGDGYIHGSGCTLPIVEITLGISVALLAVFTLVSSLCWIRKQRTLKQQRRRNFEQNGGTMLQQLLSKLPGYSERTKIFTQVELHNATNNFDESRILGRGGQGTVYKGILLDNTPVAIKKSRVGGDPRQIKDFINEVAVLSQINHRNVVKLLGCCLETEFPLLVYEFVANGTLLDHIDPLKNECSVPWETRLRIAAETAGAISYLHSTASIPIIHRDIKTINILLDHNHRAKLSDFGASKLVPLDESQVATVVQGTFGYLDPEYLRTGQLNEKSDVYSFGVVLVELLTGKKAVEFSRPEQINLAMHFESAMKEDRLWQILDGRVLNQMTNAEQLKEVASLARRCVRVIGEERPSMKVVAMELEGMIAMEKHPWVQGVDLKSEENEYLLGHVPDGASTSADYDSIQKLTAFEIADGR